MKTTQSSGTHPDHQTVADSFQFKINGKAMAISFTDQRLSPQAGSAVFWGWLKVSSNLRRVLTGVWFMVLVVHCSPNSQSVNSKQRPYSCFHSQLVPQFHCRALQILCCILHGFVHFNGSVADGQ